MVAPVKITQSSVALKIPAVSELVEGGLAVNVVDGALYSARHDGSIIRIEGDTGNGTIASASSIALGGVMAGVVDVIGTTTITAIVLREGQTRTVRFTGALTLTNSATLVLPGSASIVTVAGDYATFRGYAGGVTRCTNYTFSPTNYVTLTGTQTLINKTLTNPIINAINGTPIGLATPAAGAFTTLSSIGSALHGDGVTAGNVNVYVDAPAANYSSVQWRSAGVTKWILYRPASTNNLLLETDALANVIQFTNATGKITFGYSVAVTGSFITATFGCNGKAAQGSFSLGAAATDLPTAIALVNNLRTMAINNGIGS